MNQDLNNNSNNRDGRKPFYDKNKSNSNNSSSDKPYRKPSPYKKPYVKSHNTPTKVNKPKIKEPLSDTIIRRNKLLVQFLNSLGLNIRIIGDENKPAMIIDDKYIISGWADNFELKFTDKRMNGNVVYTVTLDENPVFDKDKVLDCINNYNKDLVYKVAVKNSFPALYLAGFYFLNRELKTGRYPIFSSVLPKVYFSKEKTDELCKELNNEGGYDLESC